MAGRSLCRLVVLGWVLVAGLAASVAQGQETEVRLAFVGRSFGTYAALGNLVLAPESAPAFITCDPVFQRNQVAGAQVAPLLEVGTIVNTAEGADDHGFKSATTTDTVESVSLLGGLVTADVVSATSSTTYDGTVFDADGEAELADLRILGIPLGFTPPPNTTVPLVGLGHIVLNEQIDGTTATGGFSQVNAVHVVITEINPLVGVGTEIVVGSARSRLQITPQFLRGYAYGAVVNVAGVNIAGPLPLEGIPCWGTNGIVQENHVAALDLPGILTTGAMVSTTEGGFAPAAFAETISEIDGLDLLGGLVSATLLRAQTQLTPGARGNPVFTAQGTKFENLSILGFPEIDDSVPFNTRLTMPGLGNLWLKLLIQEPGRLRLWMVFLDVLEENALGLPVGSRVQLGASSVGIE